WNEAVELRLDSGSTRVAGSEADLKILVMLLLTCVVEAAGGERLVVTTTPGKLPVSQSGLTPQEGIDLFRPTAMPRYGLLRSACKVVVQRMGGQIRADGTSIIVELPAAV